MNKLSQCIRELKPQDGANDTTVPYLKVYRFHNNGVKMPETTASYIYLVLDGSLRLHTPSGIMDYLAGQYSVSAIDTPILGQVLTYGNSER